LGNFLAFDASVSDDGQLDIVAVQGPGGGQLAFYDGTTLQNVDTLAPYGSDYSGGLFVAGDGQINSGLDQGRRLPPLAPFPKVSVAATTPAMADQPGVGPGVFTISRTGASAGPNRGRVPTRKNYNAG
jgi:hypothetical protein